MLEKLSKVKSRQPRSLHFQKELIEDHEMFLERQAILYYWSKKRLKPGLIDLNFKSASVRLASIGMKKGIYVNYQRPVFLTLADIIS